MDRYFLATKGCFSTTWSEVTKEQWVQAERGAGFWNTMGKPDEPGTGGFSNGYVEGRIMNMDYYKPGNYDWDPAYEAFLASLVKADNPEADRSDE